MSDSTGPWSNSDVTDIADEIADHPREFTVDEILAQELPATVEDTTDEPEETKDTGVEDADVLIDGAFDRLHFALQACEGDIERLVQLRLNTNAVIKLRRRQLAILQSQVNTYEQGMDALRDD